MDQNTGECEYIVQRGLRVGEACGKPSIGTETIRGDIPLELCNTHLKLVLKRNGKDNDFINSRIVRKVKNRSRDDSPGTRFRKKLVEFDTNEYKFEGRELSEFAGSVRETVHIHLSTNYVLHRRKVVGKLIRGTVYPLSSIDEDFCSKSGLEINERFIERDEAKVGNDEKQYVCGLK